MRQERDRQSKGQKATPRTRESNVQSREKLDALVRQAKTRHQFLRLIEQTTPALGISSKRQSIAFIGKSASSFYCALLSGLLSWAQAEFIINPDSG